MYLKHFNLSQSPFAEEPDANIFFPDAQHGKILRSLKRDLHNGTPLIRITGSEGSGKTLLCRLLLRDLPADNFEVIYIDNPVGSFQDLLYIVCRDLGMEPTAEPAEDLLPDLHDLLAESREKQKNVVLLVDEAEKLFLAALERLLRTICEVNESPVLQVVLIGRPEFDDHLKQLEAYCSEIDIETCHLLTPLTEEEVSRYLNYRLTAVGLPADTEKDVFSSGAVHKIFESARGNLRLVNILAEEALQASSADKSFLVLLDHVVEQDDLSLRPPGSGIAIAPPHSMKKIWLAGGAVAVLLLAFFLFGRGDNPEDKIADSSSPSELVTIPAKDMTNPADEIIETIPNDASESVLNEPQPPPFESLHTEETTEETPAADLEEPPTSPATADQQQVTGQESTPAEETAQQPPVTETDEPVADADPDSSQPETPAIEQEADEEPLFTQPEETAASMADEIIRLKPASLKSVPEGTAAEVSESPLEVDDTAKTRPGDYDKSLPVTTDLADELNAAAAVEVPAKAEDDQDISVEEIAEPDEAVAKTPEPSQLEKEQLYQQLLSLGERWRTGIHQDQFTIQMIALTSQDAIPNLKSMLFREEYQAIRDKLYILRKPTAPPTIYVFYGIYDSMDQARNARNNMPLFLRKHHPYALSIVNALKKSEY